MICCRSTDRAGYRWTRRLRSGATLLLVSWLLPQAALHAQRYHIHTYSETDGLPSSTVLALTQGPSARMWFATRNGIATYDGNSWTTSSVTMPRLHREAWLRWDSQAHLWALGPSL